MHARALTRACASSHTAARRRPGPPVLNIYEDFSSLHTCLLVFLVFYRLLERWPPRGYIHARRRTVIDADARLYIGQVKAKSSDMLGGVVPTEINVDDDNLPSDGASRCSSVREKKKDK